MATHDQQPEDAGEPRVSEIMERDVVTATPEMTVHELVTLMQERKISGMPVIDAEGCLVGIVTEGDLVVEDTDLHLPGYFQFVLDLSPRKHQKEFEEQLRKAVGSTVAEIMTTDVEMVGPDEPVSRAANIMVEKKVNRVPVVDDDDHLLGIVTRMDIIRMLGL